MEQMEQWEIDLRIKLQEELPDGLYDIGFPGSKVQGWTGKGGKIEMEVAFQKEIRKMAKYFKPEVEEEKPLEFFKMKGIGIKDQLQHPVLYTGPKGVQLSEELIKKFLKDIMFKSPE